MTRRAQLVVVLAMLAGCDSVSSRGDYAASTAADSAILAVGAVRMARMTEQAAPAPPVAADRKVIQTAEIRIQLEDVAAGNRSADSIANAVKGLIVSSRTTRGERGETEATLTIRVPTNRFTEAMAAMRTLGRVRVDNTNAEDVTRAYNDLEIRIAVKRETVSRLRSLLATKTAKLADILEAERELGRAIAELEQMLGEQRYLDHQVAMSTISASFFHTPVAGPGSFLDPIIVAVRQSIALLGRSVAALISWSVFLAPWVVVALLSWRVARFLARRRAGARETAAANT